VRAADRLNGAVGWPEGGTALPAADPTAAEEAQLQRWLSEWAPATGPSDAESASLRRAGLFASVGLERTAGGELDALVEASSNPRTILAAGKTALAQRLWHSAARAGVKLGRLGPAGTGAESPRAVRRLAYPPAYSELVAGEAARRGIGPLLLLSLMRQESLFDRFARSMADARGLTQVMPSTGAGIALARGQASFSADDLYDPSLSVTFGASYVADQIKYADGNVFRAVAAYNAGGGAAARWAPGSSDPDVFVEAIAYAETREYVKSIYQYHATYRTLTLTSG
jgi:soluble lytic murein transglycosylase